MRIELDLKSKQNIFLDILGKYISKGDTIYVELDLTRFKEIFSFDVTKNTFLNFYFEMFKKLVGLNGHIIVPGFSYSWGINEKKKFFDIKNTKCKTGIFPEFLRNKIEVNRTCDPMFSFLIYGKNRDMFSNIGNDSFGKKSLFEKALIKKSKLISFGLNKFDPTFVHYVEQYFDSKFKKIMYRKLLKFNGIFIDRNGKIFNGEHYSFMRPLDSKMAFCGSNIKKTLLKNNLLKEFKIFDGLIQIVDSQDFFDIGITGMKKDINFFTKNLN